MSFDDEFQAMKAALAGRFDPPFIRASVFANRPTPDRKWLVHDWIPGRTVTLFGGDGGTGKSLLALQLGVAVATDTAWLGMLPEAGPVIYITAEDEEDEVHLRLSDIVRHQDVSLADLDRLTVRSMVGFDALLAIEAEGRLATAKAFDELNQIAADEKPVLIVLDTLADFYPANESDRAKVRAFIGILRGLALRQRCAVVLLAHPSLTGLSSGSGLSGSTAWSNSVRSRIYLERVIEDGREPDPDARRLSNKKSNYGRVGLEIALRWQDGAFVSQEKGGMLDKMASEARGERVFLKLLGEFAKEGRFVKSANASGYAPKAFVTSGRAEGLSKHELHAAMERLFQKGEIVEVLGGSGPPSKHTKRIVRAS
jgi:RecA-family ATPase